MKLIAGVAVLATLVLATFVGTRQDAPAPASAGQDEVAAKLGDRTITTAELDKRWEDRDPGGLNQARQTLFDGRQAILDEFIGELLLEREATARGLTVENLLKEEMATRQRPVTEDEVKALYEGNRARLQGFTIEQARERLVEFLGEQRTAEARVTFLAELKAKAGDLVVTHAPPKLDVVLDADDPIRGPASAPVRIVEFSDFQCPFCGRVTPTLTKLRETFGDKINLVYKDFPLPNHSLAPKAAEAAHCARLQDKFWEYHDLLFANQAALDVPTLKKHAVALGLDTAKFDQCLDAGSMADVVTGDLEDGRKYGVSSTPAFFINGRLVLGAQPYDVFEKVVKEELARVEGK